MRKILDLIKIPVWIMKFTGSDRMIALLLVIVVLSWTLVIPALWGEKVSLENTNKEITENCDKSKQIATDKYTNLLVENNRILTETTKDLERMSDSLSKVSIRAQHLIYKLKKQKR